MGIDKRVTQVNDCECAGSEGPDGFGFLRAGGHEGGEEGEAEIEHSLLLLVPFFFSELLDELREAEGVLG